MVFGIPLLLFVQIACALVLVFAFATMLTWMIHLLAVRKRWLDVPNQRSGHHEPTPNSGGIAFATPFLLALLYLGMLGFHTNLMWALVGGGTLVAGIGWIDDRWSLPARYRFVAYAIASAWALWWMGGMPTLRVGIATLALGFGGTVLAFVAILWMANLMNFMDGIDGLVGAKTVVVGSVLGVLLFQSGQVMYAFILWLLVASTMGFLIWNWHPAKIFMGDTGAVLLGFVFGVLAIASERAAAVPALIWWIMFGLFFADASWTTLRRMLRGYHFYEGHRQFSFHRAVLRGHTHAQVTVGILAWTVPLLMLGVLAWRWEVYLLPLLGVSLLFSAVIWRRYQDPIPNPIR
ncbi:glycosyltransferase family 4 protein [Candidatus Uhrbacteria bacterium]|nr:glycosyltransferase family 4 protein [Candidatus Uhrbacteria bacterium]